jgi:hypothetical protein
VSGSLGFGDHAGFIEEAETVDAVGRPRHREETLAVPALDADAERDAAVPFDRARVERGVYAEAFEQERIGGRIEVVAPLQRDVGGGDDGVDVAFIDAVVPGVVHGILALDQGFVGAAEGGEPLTMPVSIMLRPMSADPKV